MHGCSKRKSQLRAQVGLCQALAIGNHQWLGDGCRVHSLTWTTVLLLWCSFSPVEVFGRESEFCKHLLELSGSFVLGSSHPLMERHPIQRPSSLFFPIGGAELGNATGGWDDHPDNAGIRGHAGSSIVSRSSSGSISGDATRSNCNHGT